MNLTGHLWTLWPTAAHLTRPQIPPPSQAWSTQVDDPDLGLITLSGRFSDAARSDTCLVIVHGLAGSPGSFYAIRAALAAERAGISHLRLCLRGADLSGQDIYHAGLVADLQAALRSADLERFRHLLVMGYSLGGHMSLRFALSPSDERVRGVAALCPPLDLSLTTEALNRPEARVYQRFVLHGLKSIYREVASRHAMAHPLDEVLGARTLREWDSLTVAPRFGFASAEDYYCRMSVGPTLGDVKIPTLLVMSDRDPMIPPWTHGELLQKPLPRVTVRKLDSGGHVAFPKRQALDDESIRWLLERRP